MAQTASSKSISRIEAEEAQGMEALAETDFRADRAMAALATSRKSSKGKWQMRGKRRLLTLAQEKKRGILALSKHRGGSRNPHAKLKAEYLHAPLPSLRAQGVRQLQPHKPRTA